MKRLIEFIKRIFFKKTLSLNEVKITIDEKHSNQKEDFLNSIKIENNDIMLLLQMKLEQRVNR